MSSPRGGLFYGWHMEIASLAIAVDSRSARKATDDATRATERQRDATGRLTRSSEQAARAIDGQVFPHHDKIKATKIGGSVLL